MHMTLMLMLLSALAGAIHVAAPDHWVPASILTWQRRWRPAGTILFVALALTLHVLLGAAVYFAFDDYLRALDPARLFPYALAFVIAVMIVRGFRFSRIRDVQRLGPHSWWGILGVVTLLGPCESIIPIFLKSASLGVGYFLPLVAFLAGTVASGITLALFGRFVWNRPLWLIRSFDWANQRVALLPVAAGVALGLRYLLKLG
jgi:hypothetical protein